MKSKLLFACVSLCSGFLAVSVGIAAPKPTEAAAGEPRVYKRIDGRELNIYIVRPSDWKATDMRPALVFYHGGSWTGGSPSAFNEHSRYFATRGLVCFLVEYRLLPGKTDIPPTRCIQDARSAMRWVRAHAGELGVDPQRIGAAGGSAGGQLAAHLGLIQGLDNPQDDLRVSARPDALVLFNPVLDNGPAGFGSARIGGRFPEFSPAHNVSRRAPPTVLFLGSRDQLIPVATLEKFQKEMKEAGVRCDLHVYPDQRHGFFNYRPGRTRYYVLTTRAADEFLVSLGWLAGAPTLPAPAEAAPVSAAGQ